MAEVVVQQGEQAQSSGNIMGDINGLFSWFATYWWVILVIIIIVVGLAVIIYFVYKWGLEKKRKDPMYVIYEQCIDACKLNGFANWVSKRRRWWFLFFSFITVPVFSLIYLVMLRGEHWLVLLVIALFGIAMWFPFAWFFYKDNSMRIINVDMQTRARYRGHARRMDGYLYMIVCVGKKWLVFEDNICLRIPENVLTLKTVEKKDKNGVVISKNLAWDKIKIDKFNFNERDNYIFMPFTSLIKEDSYFYYPTLVEGKSIIDLRQKVANSYHLMTQIIMAEQTYSHLGKVTNQAVDANVGVTASKKMPQKQRDVESGDSEKDN